VLSLLTKIASGYWHVPTRRRLHGGLAARAEMLDLDRIYPRYGFPNDMLVHLNVWSARVRDVPSRPVYGVASGRNQDPQGRPAHLVAAVQGFLWRLREKYVIATSTRSSSSTSSLRHDGRRTRLASPRRCCGSWATASRRDRRASRAAADRGSQFTLFAMWFDMSRTRTCDNSCRLQGFFNIPSDSSTDDAALKWSVGS